MNADARGVANLSGLEHATRLESLSLAENPISDLSPLTNLTNLESVGLRRCQIMDISPLANLTRLQVLRLRSNQITDISPLANLTQLRELLLLNNEIEDISPLANLTNVVELNARSNNISDISPLSNLTSLEYLDLSRCQIVDISPLSNLTRLKTLQLNHNKIVDVRPIARLPILSKLEIQRNLIIDHSPLDALSLSHFTYDQTCEMLPLPLEPRLNNRNYPSIMARWSGIDWPPVSNRPDLSGTENVALHDLWFSTPRFGLEFREGLNGFIMSGDMNIAKREHDDILALNPNMVILVDVGIRAAPLEFFPKDWPYWIRDAQGNIFREVWDGKKVNHGLMDFTHPAVQDRIVQQAVAVSKCGLYDGIFFDFWTDESPVLVGSDGNSAHVFRGLEAEQRARDNIIQRIRAETRPNFLIMGNTNRRIIPRTGPHINGGFMETVLPYDKPSTSLDRYLFEVEDSLKWLDTNLRKPHINGLEGWSIPTELPDSPMNRRWMRATTTLSLTHSNGYVVFTEPEKWTHHWYDFWDADLGRPVGPKAALYDEDISGLYIREFTNGWAVYNHSGDAQVITLSEEVQGVASGLTGTEHALPNLDGEMYLRVKPKNPADVNGDGVVNILDLTLVAQGFGTDSLEGDVNGDGAVNVFDLVFVANQL